MANMNRRLLAVSWQMPPTVLPRSIQIARSLKAMRALGWESTVVCAEPPAELTNDFELEARYRGSYDVIRVDSSQPTASQFWRRLLRRRVDAEAGWIDAGARATIALARAHAFDALVTFAQPWSDHKIGLRVARATGLPWTAHFSDPWTDSPYARNLAAPEAEEARAAERRVIQASDAVIFPTARMASLVMRKYPSEWSDKVSIVPHGFDDESETIRANPRRARDRLRLVHAGDFYGVRSPVALMEAVARLNSEGSANEIEVVFVGSVPDEHRHKAGELRLNDVMRFQGRLPYTEAARLIASADALLVVDAPGQESVFLPSKLVDYLAFARPILGLTPRAGASADLLTRLQCRSTEPDDVEGITNMLRATVHEWRAGGRTLSVGPAFAAVASDYDIGRTTSRFNEAISAAVARKSAKAVA
jgi:hypothetical protein